MMKALLLLTSLLFSFFVLTSGNAFAQNAYVTQNYAINSSASPLTPYGIDIPSFPPDPSTTCSIVFNSKTSMTSAGTFDVTVQYFSPGEILSSQGTQTGQTSFVFKDFGTDSSTTQSSTGDYEALVKFTHSATISRTGTFNSQLICSTPKTTTEIVIDRSDTDSKGKYPWATEHFITRPSPGGTTTNTSASFAEGFLIPGSRFAGESVEFQDSLGCGTNNECAMAFLYPFNSSFSGQVNIFVNATNSTFVCSGVFPPQSVKTFNIDIVKASDGSITNLFTVSSTCSITTEFPTVVDTPLSLDPNQLYFLSIHGTNTFTAFSGNNIDVAIPQTVNISIDTRVPNFVCPAFSECVNGTQSRICTDTSGNNFPDTIEFQSCFVPQEFDEIILGFEDLQVSTTDILECKKNAFTCVAIPQSLAFELPLNWEVNFELVNDSGTLKPHEAMAFITNEEAFVGFRSLELNYRPVKLDVVQTVSGGASPAACGNETTGFQASVNTDDFNGTITSENFTFPAVFPGISWATRGATQPRLQYDNNFFGANPFCSPITLCYGDCNATVGTSYQILLNRLNETSGLVLETTFRFEGFATPGEWNIVRVDLNATEIVSGAPYQIVIATDVDDVFSTRPTRLFFDDFRVQSLVQPLVVTCVDQCVGNDFLDATEQDGTCFIVTTINESSCVAIQEAILAEEVQGIFDPVALIDDLLNGTGTNVTAIEEAGFGFALFFISPFFLAFAVILIIGAFAEFKISQNGQGAGGAIFGIILLSGTIAFTLAGLFPIAFAILFIVLGGFLVVHQMQKFITGK